MATPIGNLEDVTLRALRVLREVDLIAAEDTRVTRRLLTHHGVETRLTSYYGGSERARIDGLLAALESGDVALVSDAGMPTVSDPGEALVQAAQAAGHRVVPIPGPSAVLAALAGWGCRRALSRSSGSCHASRVSADAPWRHSPRFPTRSCCSRRRRG